MRACFYFLRTEVVLCRREDGDSGGEDELLYHPDYSSNEEESGEQCICESMIWLYI